MINKHDIVNIDLNFKIERKDVNDLIDTLNKSKIFKQCLDSKGLKCITVIKLLNYIPDRFVRTMDLYKGLKRVGYKPKLKKFHDELYMLNIYGFIDMFTDDNTTFVKNIAQGRIYLDIEKTTNNNNGETKE